MDLDQGLEVGVAGLQLDHARPGRAVQGLEHHIAVAFVEIDQGDRVRADQGRRSQAGEMRDQQLLGRRPDLGGIVHHQSLWMHRLQQIGRGDIGHVEGRILAHQDDVDVFAEIQLHLLAEGDVVALRLAQGHRAGTAEQATILQRQGANIIDPLGVAAVLGRGHHQPGGVGLDVDRLNGVHLDRDSEHGMSFQAGGPWLMGSREAGRKAWRSRGG